MSGDGWSEWAKVEVERGWIEEFSMYPVRAGVEDRSRRSFAEISAGGGWVSERPDDGGR